MHENVPRSLQLISKNFFSNFVVPNLVLPGLAGINSQYVIPTSSSQLEELLKHGYPPQCILQQLQLAQVCNCNNEINLPSLFGFLRGNGNKNSIHRI